jgi:hypothetical protein
MPLDLDVNRSEDVTGHSVLRADIGGGRTLVVISGIARPERVVNQDTAIRETCRLRLGEPAETMEAATVCVGLASVSADENEWGFATDTQTVQVDPVDGGLMLVVTLGLLGERGFLHRFSYQVVLTERVVATEITGTLTWPTAVFRPGSADPSAIVPTFTVAANRVTFPSPAPPGPPSPGSPGTFPSPGPPVVEQLATGQITSLAIADNVCRATYRITDPPKMVQLTVTCAMNGLTPADGMRPVVPHSNEFLLTAAQPVRTGVDFEYHRTVIA